MTERDGQNAPEDALAAGPQAGVSPSPSGASVVDPGLLLRQVRAEVAALLVDLAPADVPKRPQRIEEHPDGLLRVWAYTDALAVHTLHDEGGPAVYITAGQRVQWRPSTALQWRPDWCALTPDEARLLGLALLGAVTDTTAASDDTGPRS